jgi:hypothetical protein
MQTYTNDSYKPIPINESSMELTRKLLYVFGRIHRRAVIRTGALWCSWSFWSSMLQHLQQQLHFSSAAVNSVEAKDKGSRNLGGISRGPGRVEQVRHMDHFNCVIELPRLPTLAPAYVSFDLYTIKLCGYSFAFSSPLHLHNAEYLCPLHDI